MYKTFLLSLALTSIAFGGSVSAADKVGIATVPVRSGNTFADSAIRFDGVVEAVRQSNLAAQVQGVVVGVNVRAGDRVHVGQELVRIDARAANQNAAANAAQVDAARANLNVASKELDRQRQLFEKQYISQAALDRMQAQYQAAQAQVKALQAQSESAQTQSRFFVINAPYSGVISEVNATVGDMASPGRSLMVIYDPAAVRITASVPAATQPELATIQFEIPDSNTAKGLMKPQAVQLIPAVDAATHTAQIRLSLPEGVKGVLPGMFARVWIPAEQKATFAVPDRMYVPMAAVIRRGELTGVYVVNEQGRALLRQVRLGRTQGEYVEVLSGIDKDEKIATDPQAAAKAR